MQRKCGGIGRDVVIRIDLHDAGIADVSSHIGLTQDVFMLAAAGLKCRAATQLPAAIVYAVFPAGTRL